MTESVNETRPADQDVPGDRDIRRKKQRRRFRRWMIAGLVLAVVFGPLLFYRATSFSDRVRIVGVSTVPASSPFNGTLKVVTYNIAHGRGVAESNWSESAEPKVSRVLDIARMLSELAPDVVILNEVDFSSTWSGGFNQADAIAREAGFPFLARQTNLDFGFLFGRWKFGNVILSRFPIENATAVDLPPLHQWEDWLVGRKRGLSCTIQLDADQKIHVMALHLEARSESIRVASTRYVAGQIQENELPLIVAGDLNTTPGWAPLSLRTGERENAFETLLTLTGLACSPVSRPQPDQLTFPSGNPESVIDWILYDPANLQLIEQEVVTTMLSDHLPVVATFRFTTE